MSTVQTLGDLLVAHQYFPVPVEIGTVNVLAAINQEMSSRLNNTFSTVRKSPIASAYSQGISSVWGFGNGLWPSLKFYRQLYTKMIIKLCFWINHTLLAKTRELQISSVYKLILYYTHELKRSSSVAK